MNIFCTRKLETFIPVQKKTNANLTDPDNWICQLLAIGGKKCLLFLDKKTLYCVLILDVKKKDLQNISSIFVNEFIEQLRADKLLIKSVEQNIREKNIELVFYETDNDQKTLATLRDNTYHLQSYLFGKENKLASADRFRKSSINQIILGSRQYHKAVELMQIEMQLNR